MKWITDEPVGGVRYCLHHVNRRHRRTQPFWCVVTMMALLLIAVVVS